MFWDIEGVNDIRKMQFLPFHHSIIPPAGMQDKAGNQGKANSLEIFFFFGTPTGNGWKWNGNPNRIHVESIGIPLLALNCGYTKSIGALDDRTKTRMIVNEIESLELA